MGFNLQIGFRDLDVIEDDTTTSFGGSSSGGGIGGGPITIGQKHLIISNEQIANVTPPQLNTVSVSWNTNMPATSQVIYGLVSGGPYVLNLSATNFGYSMSTVEDMTKWNLILLYFLGFFREKLILLGLFLEHLLQLLVLSIPLK